MPRLAVHRDEEEDVEAQVAGVGQQVHDRGRTVGALGIHHHREEPAGQAPGDGQPEPPLARIGDPTEPGETADDGQDQEHHAEPARREMALLGHGQVWLKQEGQHDDRRRGLEPDQGVARKESGDDRQL